MSSPSFEPPAAASRRIQQALHALADAPIPLDVADRALAAARRRRRVRTGGSGLAVVAVLGAVFFVYSGQPAPPVVTPGPTASANSAASPRPCVSYTSSSDGSVDPAGWPDFVSIVVDRLSRAATMDRSDFHMSSGYGWCVSTYERSPLQAARAVIGLGDRDAAGLLALEIYRSMPIELASCVDVFDQVPEQIDILFCDDPVGTTPLVFGQTPVNPNRQPGDEIAVVAIYPDEKVVSLELSPGAAGFAFTVEDLRDVVTDPGLYALIP